MKFERTHKEAKERLKFEKHQAYENCVRLKNAWALNELKQKLLKEEREKRKEKERLESLERSIFEWNSYVFVERNR